MNAAFTRGRTKPTPRLISRAAVSARTRSWGRAFGFQQGSQRAASSAAQILPKISHPSDGVARVRGICFQIVIPSAGFQPESRDLRSALAGMKRGGRSGRPEFSPSRLPSQPRASVRAKRPAFRPSQFVKPEFVLTRYLPAASALLRINNLGNIHVARCSI